MRTRQITIFVMMTVLVPLVTGCLDPITLPRAVFTWEHETAFDVLFDATLSDAGNSMLVSWEWEFGDGETDTGELVRHTFQLPGEYSVKLTVTDVRGFSNSARGTVRAIRELRVPEEYWTIQEAIDDAGSGDFVVLSPGRYIESFTFRGKAICVRSTDPDDPTIVASTIIEPGGTAGDYRAGPVVTFDSGEGLDSVIEGLTIRGVAGVGAVSGNGVIVRSSSPTIRGNAFAGHLAGTSGAALYLVDSAALVVGNQFNDNTCDPLLVGVPGPSGPGVEPGFSSEGGAIKVLCTSKAPRILDNQFQRNSAIAGGAIHVGLANMGGRDAVAQVDIQNNTFIDNSATGKYSPSNKTDNVGGAIQAEYESLIDLGVHDTNAYFVNLPQDIYYEL